MGVLSVVGVALAIFGLICFAIMLRVLLRAMGPKGSVAGDFGAARSLPTVSRLSLGALVATSAGAALLRPEVLIDRLGEFASLKAQAIDYALVFWVVVFVPALVIYAEWSGRSGGGADSSRDRRPLWVVGLQALAVSVPVAILLAVISS